MNDLPKLDAFERIILHPDNWPTATDHTVLVETAELELELENLA